MRRKHRREQKADSDLQKTERTKQTQALPSKAKQTEAKRSKTDKLEQELEKEQELEIEIISETEAEKDPRPREGSASGLQSLRQQEPETETRQASDTCSGRMT